MPLNPKQSPPSRVALVEPPYDDETQAALSALGPPIQLFRAFARRPDRARAIRGWGGYYMSRQSALSLRQRELVIDRTTALCGAGYEWGIHIALLAERVKLTVAQVDSLAGGSPDDSCWDHPADRAVIRAVDALHHRHDLADDEWAALAGAVGDDGALDLVLVCGWYHAISFAARALRLPLEPGTAGLPHG